MPYTIKTLCSVLERPEPVVSLAIDKMQELQMITIDEKGIIKIKNWAKYQNLEGLEKTREQTKERVAKYRKRKKESEENLCNVTGNDDVTPKKEIEKENKEEEQELDKDVNKKERRKSNVVSLEDKKMEEVNEAAVKLLNHYESITGKPGIFKFESIVLAISKHGADNVKMAIDKSGIFSNLYCECSFLLVVATMLFDCVSTSFPILPLAGMTVTSLYFLSVFILLENSSIVLPPVIDTV